jgi:hypothetical protein
MAEKGKKPSATVILIPKQLRMDWTDLLALDQRITDATFRIACVISTHFGNKSGLTYVSKKKLAEITGLDERTVGRASTLLEHLGYLIVQRREVGERRDGRRVFGGRGTANEYLPAIDSVQISATDRGLRLVNRAREQWEKIEKQKQDSDVLLPEIKQDSDVLLPEYESRTFDELKQDSRVLPTLTSPTEKNSTRARGPSSPDGLGPFGALISKRLGDAAFRSWFAKAAIAAETPDSVTLSVDSKFKRDHITAQFGPQILDCCRAARPTVLRVDVIVRDAA